jgi:hypothetical protein
LSAVANSSEAGEIVKRALAYPYPAPDRSYIYVDGRARELPAGELDLAGRRPLLAYGANAAPEALARKLAPLAGLELPVLRAELEGFDVVYSAHVSIYGAVPATLAASPGTTIPTFVIFPTAEQLELIAATERLNYERSQLRGIACRLDGGATLAELDAFLSTRGPLTVAGAPIALAAITATERQLAAMEEREVLDRVRAQLSPQLTLEAFVLRCVEQGGIRPLPTLEGS